MAESSESPRQKSLAEAALEHGFLTQAQLDEALEVQKKLTDLGVPEDLPTILRKRGYLSEEQITSCRKSITPNRIIAGFEIIEAVGKGAMGAVYKARQISMDRIVALKILPQDLAKDPTFRERFIREARASGKLDHLNIVHGIDVGEERGITYFAMEFVDGQTIKRRLRKEGALNWEESVRIVLQIADALAYAWRHGIIHRDIKPDNIMMAKDGTAKLCDLGLAKELHAAEESGLTQSGQAVGTPHYISPEQAKGRKDIDTRADIYSLGATLYHMVCGKVPFEETNSTAVMVMHVTDEAPSPREHNVEVPADLELAIAKAMAKDPKERYQEPAYFAEDLALILNREDPYHAAGFKAKSSIKYTPSTRPPPKEEDIPTSKYSRVSGRSGRVTTGPHAPIRPKLGKTGPLAPVGPRDPEVGRSTTKNLEPIRPRQGKTGKQEPVGPPGDGDEKFSKGQFAEPVVMRPREKRDTEPLPDIPAPEPSQHEPPAAKKPSERHPAPEKEKEAAPRPAVRAAEAQAVQPATPALKPPERAGAVLAWWFVGLIAISAGFYFGFTLTPVDAGGGETKKGANTKTGEEPAVVVKVGPDEKTQPKAVVIKPDNPPPVQPSEIVPVKPPPKIVEPTPPSEPPPPDPVSTTPKFVTKPPDVPPAEPDQDLEKAASLAFDKVYASLKKNQVGSAKTQLDEMQAKFANTTWYAQNRVEMESAYERVKLSGKPWDDLFAAPAIPLDGPTGDRWELVYDQLTFEPNERQEWQLLLGSKVNWRPGSITLSPSGRETFGIVSGIPVQQVERLEAQIEPTSGADYGWALYSDQRFLNPVATCWYESDGTIHLWANEVEKPLSLRDSSAAGPKHMVVQFKGRKAWVDVGGKKEELNLAASPTGRYFPAIVASKAPVKIGSVRMHTAFEPGDIKLMQDETARTARLKAEAPRGGLHKIKIIVASEYAAGVFVNDKRASPDTKGGFTPATYLFSVPLGSVISVRQFPPAGKDGGAVLLDICPQDGANKHAGTGLTPHIWVASGEMGNWMWDLKVHAGWQLPTPALVDDPLAKTPPGLKAKFVRACNKSNLLHYVFDPADMK
ncbi:MAG: protein kinase [Planctomycetes bacterium]|nr:protein kinase [Planctomycetota bacterium]